MRSWRSTSCSRATAWPREIEVNPAGVVDYGYVALGEQAERTFVATNVGDTVLQVEAHPQSKEAHIAPTQFALAPGESARLTLFFAPEALGDRRGRVLLVSNDVKDRARPLEYKGHGVLADIDLTQIVEVLVSRGEKTQPLAVDWDNAPVVQKDGTKVDVAFAISDSLRQALIGREMVIEWTRLDENYAPKGKSSTQKQKVAIYESSGRAGPSGGSQLAVVGRRQSPRAAQSHYPELSGCSAAERVAAFGSRGLEVGI